MSSYAGPNDFDDERLFRTAIFDACHEPSPTLKPGERARFMLDILSESGALGYAYIVPPFTVVEVIAFFELLAKKSEAEEKAAIEEVMKVIMKACHVKYQDVKNAGLTEKRFSIYAEYWKTLQKRSSSSATSSLAQKGQRPTVTRDRDTLRHSGALAFLGGNPRKSGKRR